MKSWILVTVLIPHAWFSTTVETHIKGYQTEAECLAATAEFLKQRNIDGDSGSDAKCGSADSLLGDDQSTQK